MHLVHVREICIAYDGFMGGSRSVYSPVVDYRPISNANMSGSGRVELVVLSADSNNICVA